MSFTTWLNRAKAGLQNTVGCAPRRGKRNSSRRKLVLELLEDRCLLSTVGGHAFDDFDSDGSRDVGEPGLAAVTVYLDADNDGQFDGGESSVVTSSSGAFTFNNVPAADYVVRAILPAGYQRTLPAAGFYAFTLGAGQAKLDVDFGQSLAAPSPIPLQIGVTNGAGGVVTSSVTGFQTGSSLSGDFVAGTTVTLNAVAVPGATFLGWTGADSVSGAQAMVVMNSPKVVTATFAFPLTVVLTGTGQGQVNFFSSSGSGILNGTAHFAAGSSVQLQAVANSQSTFTGWSGAGAGTGSILFLTMDGAKSATALFTLQNSAPTASKDTVTTNENTPIDIAVLANDSDADGDALAVQSVTQGSKGSVSINADGTVRYVPTVNLNGIDRFTYTVRDATGATSTGTVSVTIVPVDDTPHSDLGVAFSITPAPLALSDLTVTYHVAITNFGQAAVDDVVATLWIDIFERFDAGSVLSATSPQGTCTIGDTGVACSVDSLAPGATAHMTVQWMPRSSASGQFVQSRVFVTGNALEPDVPPGLSAADIENLFAPRVEFPEGEELEFILQIVASNNLTFLDYTVPARLVVNTAADNEDPNDGLTSLREAIEEVNGFEQGPPVPILFRIAGEGVHTIHLSSALPAIRGPILIDGFTQPGARQDTSAPGNDAIVLIELDGSGAGLANGLELSAGRSTVRGLAINRFAGSGIVLDSAGDNIIEQNFIGTDVTGTQNRGNGGHGIWVASSTNLIGGPDQTDANIIAFNAGAGVAVGRLPYPTPAPLPPGLAGTGYEVGNIPFNFSAPDQFGVERSLYEFYGRFVIVDLCANFCNPCRILTADIPDVVADLDALGIDMEYVQVLVHDIFNNPSNQVEASQWAAGFGLSTPVLQGPRAAAVIADWFAHEAPAERAYPTLILLSPQMEILEIAFGSLQREDLVGRVRNLATLPTGLLPLRGRAPTAGNAIQSNAIHSNGGLGIDLGIDGVTRNDTGDTDAGPNQLQNFPVLTAVTATGAGTTIQGRLDSTANATFHLEFFTNTTTNPAGFDEGQRLLGSAEVTTGASGIVLFTANLATPTPAGDFVTATATRMIDDDLDPETPLVRRDTSEFSLRNAAPLAVHDSAATSEDTPTNIAVLANDSDADGDTLTIQSVTQGSKGSVSISADGTVRYTPTLNLNGSDTFTYTARDPSGATATATVSVTIVPVNDAPTAVNDVKSTPEDTAAVISVLGNDLDDGPAGLLTVSNVTQGAHGLVQVGNGIVIYTPAQNYNGPDSFSYTITDAEGASATAQVNVTVTAVNDAPAFGVVNDRLIDEDAGVQIVSITGVVAGPATALDEAGQTVTITATSSNTLRIPHPTISGTGATRTLSFQPVANNAQPAFITITASDGQSANGTFSRTFLVNFNALNDAPTFSTIGDVAIFEDGSIFQTGVAPPQTVLINDVLPGPVNATDEASQIVTFLVSSTNSGLIGVPTISAAGTTRTLTYQPAANKSGAAIVTVTAFDGQSLNSSFARSFTINVTSVNDQPSFDLIANQTVDEDAGAKNVSITGVVPGPVTATDEAAQVVTFTATSSNPLIVPNPTITGVGGSRTLTYQSLPNANGSVTITVRGDDGNGGLSPTFVRTFTITVNPVSDGDMVIAANPGPSPEGRLRDHTDSFSVINAGPDTASNVVLTVTIPVGTTFKSSNLTPKLVDANKVTWVLGAMSPGTKIIVSMTIFVTSSAPAIINSTATITSAAQDGNPANNIDNVSTAVVSVGTFVVIAPAAVTERTSASLSLAWTVPGGSWRELKTVDLRLRDGDGTILWLRFDEAENTLSLFNPHSGKFGPGGTPGSKLVLANQYASIDLEKSTVKAAGPTSPTVTLTLEVTFGHLAAERTYQLEIAAADDLGNHQDFANAAVLRVTGKHASDLPFGFWGQDFDATENRLPLFETVAPIVWEALTGVATSARAVTATSKHGQLPTRDVEKKAPTEASWLRALDDALPELFAE